MNTYLAKPTAGNHKTSYSLIPSKPSKPGFEGFEGDRSACIPQPDTPWLGWRSSTNLEFRSSDARVLPEAAKKYKPASGAQGDSLDVIQ